MPPLTAAVLISIILHSQKGWFHLFKNLLNTGKFRVDPWSVSQPTDQPAALSPAEMGHRSSSSLTALPPLPEPAQAQHGSELPSLLLEHPRAHQQHPCTVCWAAATFPPCLRRRRKRSVFQRAKMVTSLERGIVGMGSRSPNLALAKVGMRCCK